MKVDVFDLLTAVGTLIASASAVQLGGFYAGALVVGCIAAVMGIVGASRK